MPAIEGTADMDLRRAKLVRRAALYLISDIKVMRSVLGAGRVAT
jgi:hypothetical protein